MLLQVKQYALIILVFIGVAAIYFLPTFNGKTHSMEDVRQFQFTIGEAKEYYDNEGEALGWSNQIFGGMPSDLIYLGVTPSLFNYFSYLTLFSETSYPFQNLLLCFIGFFVFLLCLGISPLIAFFGSLAYGFMTFTFSSIEAAHVNKVFVIALMPAVLGGFYLMAKEKLIAGFVVFTYHFGLQVYYFHYQITYYLMIILLIVGLFFFFKLLLNNKIKVAIFILLLSIVGGGLGIVSNAQRLVTTQEYSKYTMRGGSALSEDNPQASAQGLQIDYAFSWSYGVGETFTVLIPGLYGGSSREPITERSAIYKLYQNPQVLEQGWPLYHGAMPSTSGPVYFGAIVIFLFLLSFRLVKNDLKWPLYALTLIAFMMAWGKNFPVLNYFLFDNLPFYNKFRTPMMAMSIAQVSVLCLAILSLASLFETKLDRTFVKKNVLPVFYGLGGFLLFMMIFGSGIVGITSENDARYFKDNYNLVNAIQETRGQLIFSDSFRSLFLVGIAFLLIWLYATEKLKKQTALLLIGSLMVADLIQVDMRYLTWSDFKYSVESFEKPEPEPADLEILKDADPHYRVMDFSRDPFNTNDAAAFHKLVGGYHAAKLSRYQDLISEYIVPSATRDKALDMLNCKYFIATANEGERRISMKRETALGNAWFVNNVVTTLSDREEMDSLKIIDPATDVVINIKEQKISVSEDIALEDESASIEMYFYHPDTLRYSYGSDYQRFVVFSEVYYPHWKLYFNGESIPLHRVNYTLRGAILPPGKGDLELVYEYKPAKVYWAETRYASLLVVLGTIAWGGFSIFGMTKKQKPQA
jgi:hypothetical protein